MLAILHVLMYFTAGRRPAHWVGFTADVCVIMLMSYAGGHSVWGEWALATMGERLSRALAFFFLSMLFGSLSYMHALMAKLPRIRNIFIILPPALFLVLNALFLVVDVEYFGVLRQLFYVVNFALIIYVYFQLVLSWRRGDRNSLRLLGSFTFIALFFIVAVCHDFKNHEYSYLDYLALYICMVLLDINLIVKSGLKMTKSKSERWTAPLSKQIEDLQSSNQSKDRFLSIIAHDLKNPISSLKMISDIYMEEAREANSVHRMDLAESLSDSIDNIYKLLENLLAWTRSQNDTIKCNPEDVEVAQLIEHLQYSVESICNAKHIGLKFMNNGVDTIYADPNMIQTVLRNLVTNAVKYSYQDNIGDVIFDRDAGNSYVRVVDYGVGMSPEVIDRLFKIDKISSTSGTKQEQGTGLGLILCNEFVRKHGGGISVISDEGLGTTFQVSLPKVRV